MGFAQTHPGLRAPGPAQGPRPLTLVLVCPLRGQTKQVKGGYGRHEPDRFGCEAHETYWSSARWSGCRVGQTLLGFGVKPQFYGSTRTAEKVKPSC